MKTTSLVAIAAFMAVLGCIGRAEAKGAYQNDNELKLVKTIGISVINDVTGNCLSNPHSLQTEAELIFRRSRIAVKDYSGTPGAFFVSIEVHGSELDQSLGASCAISLRVELARFAPMPEGHLALVTGYFNGADVVWAKSELQERVRSRVSEIATDLANEILKARGQ